MFTATTHKYGVVLKFVTHSGQDHHNITFYLLKFMFMVMMSFCYFKKKLSKKNVITSALTI